VADGSALASALDPDGRLVELHAERWSHILAGHPELARHLASLTRAIREPDRRIVGRQEDEE
jgi:type II secretory pathway predicted ATPase ExeA